MAGISIGSVSVNVVPSLASGDFFEKTRAKVIPDADRLGVDIGAHIRTGIDDALKDLSFKVGADTTQASLDIDKLKIKIDDLSATRTVTIKVNYDTSAAAKLKAVIPGSSGGGSVAGTVAGAAGGGGNAGGSSGLAAAGLGPPLSNPYVLTGAVAAGLSALPFIAQAAAGGIVFALGGAITAVAIKFALENKVISDQFVALAHNAGNYLRTISAPFQTVLIDIADAANGTLTAIVVPLGNAIRSIAGPFDIFATDLVRSFGSPAVALSIDRVGVAFGNILKALGPQLPGDINNVALGITRVANAVASDPKAFADFISFLIDTVGFSLSMIAALARAATWIEGHWSTIDLEVPFKKVYTPIAADIGKVQTAVSGGLLVLDSYFNNFLAHGISFGVSYLKVIADAFGWIPGIGSKIHAFANAGIADLYSLGTGTTQYGAIATRTAAGAMTTFTTALNQMGLGSNTTRTDVGNLTTAITNQGVRSDAARSSRATLIADLEKSGVNARTATGLVNNYISSLTKIPASKSTSFGVAVKPSTFKISETAGSVDDPIGELHLSAAGSRVPGYGGGDRHLYLLEGGEAVVDKFTTARHAADLKAWGVPGFALGGLAGLAADTAAGNASFGATWGSAVQKDTQAAIAADIRAALNADIRAVKASAATAAAGVAGPGGGNAVANMILARSMYPAWANGAEWAAWASLWTQESGWNQLARNASSGAYGIPQALPASKMGAAANPPQSNPHAQISWGAGYIKGRYGDPINAEAHERAFNWYDRGGWWPSGGLGLNTTGQPEAVLTAEEASWLKSAGTSGGSSKGIEQRLDRLIAAAERAPSQTGAHTAAALNGTARGAVNAGIHSGRGGY